MITYIHRYISYNIYVNNHLLKRLCGRGGRAERDIMVPLRPAYDFLFAAMEPYIGESDSLLAGFYKKTNPQHLGIVWKLCLSFQILPKNISHYDMKRICTYTFKIMRQRDDTPLNTMPKYENSCSVERNVLKVNLFRFILKEL